MHFEGITLYALLAELRETIEGGYIQKIHQPTENLLRIQVYKGIKHTLLITTGRHARIHLTTQHFENPQTPPGFCMLLRKHIMGGVIESLEQVGLERVVNITIRTRESSYIFALELMGTRSNVILVRDSKILGAIHARVGEKSYRPGAEFEEYHPAEKLNSSQLKFEKLVQALDETPSADLYDALFSNLAGFGPRSINEILARSNLSPKMLVKNLVHTDLEHLFASTQSLFDPSSGAFLYYRDERAFDCTKSQYQTYEKYRSVPCPSLSEALDQIHAGHEQEPLADQRTRIAKALKARLKKTQNVLVKSEADLEKAKEFDKHKLYGDLITANLGSLSKGQQVVELVGYDGTQIELKLDPKLSPVENAQSQYSRYKKLKRGVEKIEIRVLELRNELEYFTSLQDEMDAAESLDELRSIENRIDLGESFQPRANKSQSRPAAVSGPRVIDYKGYKIYVGRNSNQNDALVRQAQRDDIWMHAKDRPGSHVVIRTNRNQKVPSDVIERAAELAAFYSRAQNATKVTVMYTRAKNLKKPKGAKPGLVQVSREDGTITVKPRGEE